MRGDDLVRPETSQAAWHLFVFVLRKVTFFSTMGLAVCNSLWIGETLGAVERACARSAMRHGHRMRLYCYDRVDGIPDGVEVAGADTIVPRDKIRRYKTGSVALFANHFRYALQRQEAGLWMDMDNYCLKPLDFDDPYLFGRQSNGNIAIGVLRLPKDSPVLRALLSIFEVGAIPVWARKQAQNKARAALDNGEPIPWETMRWGLTGPRALTYYLEQNELSHLAKPQSVFYPADFTDAEWILDPARSLSEFVREDTVALHLWNEKIKSFKDKPAPAGSFLAQIQEEGR